MIWNWISGIKNSAGSSGQFDAVMNALQAKSRPCVLLRSGKGNSKIGGIADCLPADEWPKCNGVPLSLLAQLDLSEIRLANGPDWLPSDGRLLFFYDTEQQPWGFAPSDRDGWCVIYQPSGASDSSSVAAPDLPRNLIFAEKRVCASASQSLPDASPDRIDMDLSGLTDGEFDQLYDATEERCEGLPAHQVGGFPSPIQGDHMELEAQLVSNGLYCGDSSGYDDPRARELGSGARDWVLLLQLDSDDDVDMMWGDGGRLYYWIREQDARRADFGNVWLVLQCS